ncbi:MAG: hypothetical protein WAW17_26320 [Rhodococcus sp. (in: high G+C Gram-positive bacteria)]|uniref:hypothetical protein n=1 Tax=Rhodococcus sp. TaxID=1831 RepID=UPI003BB01C57
MKFGIDIAETDETLAGSIRDALGFGAPGDVALPAEVVTDLTRFGPEFMSPNGELSAVLIGEAKGIEALNGKRPYGCRSMTTPASRRRSRRA